MYMKAVINPNFKVSNILTLHLKRQVCNGIVNAHETFNPNKQIIILKKQGRPKSL